MNDSSFSQVDDFVSSIDSLKANLVSQIKDIIAARGLNQTDAAKLTKTTRPRIIKLQNGDSTGVSLEALLEILIHLDNEIIVQVIPVPTAKKIRLVGSNGHQ